MNGGGTLKVFTRHLSAMLMIMAALISPSVLAQLPDSVITLVKSAYEQRGHSDISAELISGAIPCNNPDASLPREPNTRGGRVSVMVTCPDATRYIQINVSVHGSVVVAKEAMQRGEVISEQDIKLKPGILSEVHRNALDNLSDVVGMTLLVTADADQVITQNMIKAPVLVERNQVVTISAAGGGFNISRTVTALENGAMGEVIRVRMDNRETIRGRVVGHGMLEAISF